MGSLTFRRSTEGDSRSYIDDANTAHQPCSSLTITPKPTFPLIKPISNCQPLPYTQLLPSPLPQPRLRVIQTQTRQSGAKYAEHGEDAVESEIEEEDEDDGGGGDLGEGVVGKLYGRGTVNDGVDTVVRYRIPGSRTLS